MATHQEQSSPPAALPDYRQTRLEEALSALSEEALNEQSIKEHASFFARLYARDDDGDPGFRHSYSGITNVLYGGEMPATLEKISEAVKTAQRIVGNLDQIKPQLINEGCDQHILRCFDKLTDHVSLEMQRLTVMESAFRGVDGTNKTISELLETQQTQFDEQNKKIRKARKNAEGMQTQYITILGVFAAIVLVFNGAISYSTSAMNSLQAGSSFPEVALIVLIVGFVLANTVFILLAFLWKVVAKRSDSIPTPVWIAAAVFDVSLISVIVYLAIACCGITLAMGLL